MTDTSDTMYVSSAAGSTSDTSYPLALAFAGSLPDAGSTVTRVVSVGQGSMTKVHPLRVFAVVAIAATLAALTGCGSSSTVGKVNGTMGVDASDCGLVGRMLVGGTSEKVYRCTSGSQGTIGCYAINGNEVSDVSKPFQALIAIQQKTVDCGQ